MAIKIATAIASRTTRVDTSEYNEPLVPIPSKRLGNWLLGALIFWQAAVFWIYPIYLTLLRGWKYPDLLDWQSVQRYRAFEFEPLLVELTFGILLALSANVAFALAKSGYGNWTGIVGGLAIYTAAVLGAMATNAGATNSYPSPIFPTLVSLATLAALSLFWQLAPVNLNRKLLHLNATFTSSGDWKPQIRLLHLFYLLSGVAILLSMTRYLPRYFRLEELFHEPVDKFLIFLLLLSITTFFAWLAYVLALAPGRKVWWLLLTPILVDGIAFVFTVLNSGITGKPSSWQTYLSVLCIFSAEFAFLSGTALALRLLGYRLVRA